MAATLRELAGAAFRVADVVEAAQRRVPAEELVLDRSTFVPHARSGIAAALTTPFDWSLPARASIAVRVPVMDERGAIDAEMAVQVQGPGDVLELDPRQVIRHHPRPDVADAEVDDLVHVEFDRPDLPWMFTPAGPDGHGRLVPWITLVVAERRHVQWRERRGAVRTALLRRDQLQSLSDAWAWAHAQVAGAKGADAAAAPTLPERLSERNAAHNLSRLVCPRRLAPRTSYVACVVPTFLAGVRAALGLSPVPMLAPAWGSAADFDAGDPFDAVLLPVFHSWSFSTGEGGSFESLARRLRPAVAPPEVGRRRVDTARPWPGAALDAGEAGDEMVVEGPVVSPQRPEDAPDQAWPPEAEQHWPAALRDALVARLNEADRAAHAEAELPPLVGPPLYAGRHAGQARIDPSSPSTPPWFAELNLDPRHRIVAGLGTRIVQAEQEDLMLAAWNQVAGIEAANRALRLAQLARHVGASLHRRHLRALSDAALLRMTERVHAKLLAAPRRSVWAAVEASSLPLPVVKPSFRRLLRARGPLLRTALGAGTALDDRRQHADRLTVAADRFTADWVQRYRSPDGVRGLSEVAAARIDDAVAARVANASAESLLGGWRRTLPGPAPSDRFADIDLRPTAEAGTLDLRRELTQALAGRVLAALPSPGEAHRGPEAAAAGVAGAMLLDAVLAEAHATGLDALDVPATEGRRLGLQLAVDGRVGAVGRVGLPALRSLVEQVTEAARAHADEVAWGVFERQAAALRRFFEATGRVDGPRMAEGLRAIGQRVVAGDPLAEPARDRVPVPPLRLVEQLDPAVTVPRRIAARLRGGSGRAPSWLRPDWFDDGRIEPVMAHPRFPYPMYEPLHRHEPEWMIPGLASIRVLEMATLLQTNSRFVEAYLVGLNHEMARELLWRGYPTDQRGTCFASFWTGGDELTADLHQAAWRHGALGSHVRPDLDGQIVFMVRGDLIRRYPGTVAHAVLEHSVDAEGLPLFQATSPARPLFHLHLPPNLLLAGFSLTRQRIATPGERWWFTLSENPTEPRFGLDPSREGTPSRDNLVWSDFAVAPGGFLRAAEPAALAFDGSRWGASSADMAYLLFQLPARAAFLGTTMVAKATR